MIPMIQLEKRAKKIYDDVTSAKIYMGNTVFDGVINKKIIVGNSVKIFVALDSANGEITKIEILDSEGEILQFQEMQITKDSHYKFLAVVEIIVDNEVIN